MDKKALLNSRRLKFSYNDQTDKNVIAQTTIDLTSSESAPDCLKQRFKAFEKETVLGHPYLNTMQSRDDYLRGRMLASLSFDLLIARPPAPCFCRRA